MEDKSLLTVAEAKVSELKADGREEFQDSFVGEIKGFHRTEDGTVEFTAIVAQCDTVNKNGRLYPRSEFEANLKRVNRACRAGRFKGSDGHPGFFSGSKPSEVCVKWERVFIQDNDVYLEGTLIPTSKGADIGTAWEHGIAPEFSILGYGDPEETKLKGKKPYYTITNYIWDRTDIVDAGAAKTKVVKYSHDAEEAEEVSIMPEEVKTEEVKEEITPQPEQITAPAVEPKVEPQVEAPKPEEKPEVDIEAIMERIERAEKAAVAKAEESGQKAVDAAIKAAREATELSEAKKAAIEKLSAGDEHIATIVGKAIDRAETVEDVIKAVEDMAPAAAGLKRPYEPHQVGEITGQSQQLNEFWVPHLGEAADRPDTVEGVRSGLLEGLSAERSDPSTPSQKEMFSMLMDNMWDCADNLGYKQYFYACTKQGFREAATTTTQLGTTLPQVLPMIRSIFPMLIPYEIQSVQPISLPTGRIHFLKAQYGSGTYSDSDFDDSSAFDSDWSDHDEGETKSQTTLEVTYTDVEAEEKALYYQLTSVLMQDLPRLHGVDAEQFLLTEMANQIAREINMEFISTMYQGATAAALTFGTTKPSSWNSQEDWTALGLAQYLAKTSGKIAEKLYTDATWIITDTATAAMLSGMNMNWSSEKNPANQYGLGMRKTGVFQNTYDVYVAAWMGQVAANTLLMGFKPPSWFHTATVFCPYIMGYISPQHYDPSTNIAERAVASRYDIKVVNGDGLGYLTVSRGTAGADPWASA